ncbi:MAG: molybdenum cofactor guanylyltransferase [Dehalococcoidales bacterium]|nr:molybdenum cofactor guanylyltransferase [Dehalococcoidales bacterium]
MDIGCIILAGGKGLRLGCDKVLETAGNKTLLEQVISIISLLCNKIVIVTAQGREIPKSISRSKLEVVTDIFPDRGPLGGIYTGLTRSECFYNITVACDMPFLNQALLRYMMQLSTSYDVVVPRINNMVEPLHSVYSKSCLGPIEDMLKQDKLNVNKLLSLVRARYVEAEEIDRFDPEHLSFFNINTKADLEIAREMISKGNYADDKC